MGLAMQAFIYNMLISSEAFKDSKNSLFNYKTSIS